MKRIATDETGASAIEFAVVAPVFLYLLFSIFDIGLLTWNSSLTASAADAVSKYLRTQRVTHQTITADGMRTTACNALRGSNQACTADKLKIALINAANPVTTPPTVPTLIENSAIGTVDQDAYIVAIGYEWGLMFPTSRMLLSSNGVRGQVQSTTYAVLAERPID